MTRAGTSWRVAQFRPGSRPLAAMTSRLASNGALYCGYNGPVPLEEIVDTSLRVSKRGLIDAFRKARLPDGVNLLVVVDQFEELFRYQTLSTSAMGGGERSEEGVAFVNLLLEATPVGYPDLHRTNDAFGLPGNCAQYPGLPEAINEGNT